MATDPRGAANSLGSSAASFFSAFFISLPPDRWLHAVNRLLLKSHRVDLSSFFKAFAAFDFINKSRLREYQTLINKNIKTGSPIGINKTHQHLQRGVGELCHTTS